MKKLNSNNPKFFDNTEQSHIVITPCKLENLLRDFEEGMKIKELLYGLIGIFLTVLIALVTSDFRDILGVPKAGWQGAFIVLLLVSFMGLCYFGYKIKKGNILNRNELINKLLKTRKGNFMAKKKTSLKVAKVASKQLRSKKTSKPAKTTAASALSQREKGRKKK